MRNQTLSVVAPNWNGEKLLGPCLESVVKAFSIAGCPRPWEIIVADDASTDGSLALLREAFPQVQVVTAPRRSGFIANADRGIERCTNPYFLLLNNDVTLHEEFFVHWKACFDDAQVFSVTCRLLRPDGLTFDSGRRVGLWDRGLIRHWVVCSKGAVGPTLFASGGASIYDTQRFRTIGGLDDLFRPMYLEDFDLSYRGWKRGWKTIYQPALLAYHQGSVSSKQAYRARELNTLVAKNHFLFIWKNITDSALIRRHILWLPFWLAQSWRPGRRLVTLGFLKALSQMREALKQRSVERIEHRVTDAEIWNLFRPSPEDLRYSPYLGWAGTS